MLAESASADIAVYSWWCTEGLQKYLLVRNGIASDAASGFLGGHLCVRQDALVAQLVDQVLLGGTDCLTLLVLIRGFQEYC